MISWHLVKNKKQLETDKDYLYFPDWVTQTWLMHIFDVGHDEIDEYEAWQYGPEDMRRLKKVLQNWIGRHDLRVDKSIQIETIQDGSGPVSTHAVLHLMSQTIEMIDRGLEAEAELRFYGD